MWMCVCVSLRMWVCHGLSMCPSCPPSPNSFLLLSFHPSIHGIFPVSVTAKLHFRHLCRCYIAGVQCLCWCWCIFGYWRVQHGDRWRIVPSSAKPSCCKQASTGTSCMQACIYVEVCVKCIQYAFNDVKRSISASDSRRAKHLSVTHFVCVLDKEWST